GFGTCKLKPAQEVNLEVSPGTGNFSDKIKLDKVVDKPTEKSLERKKAIADFKSADTVYLTRAEADAVRQNSIERQCAVKTAGNIIASTIQKSKTTDVIVLSQATLALADRLLCYIKMEEPKLPEPPEEP
ncbi:hypothetical protein LCGC14_1831240, partial [marine sediment metagenome]